MRSGLAFPLASAIGKECFKLVVCALHKSSVGNFVPPLSLYPDFAKTGGWNFGPHGCRVLEPPLAGLPG
jgi:hypothetical protein